MRHSLIAKTFTWEFRLSAIAALLAGLLMVMQPVWADAYEVTNTDNSGPGSLRQAITDAHNHPGPDTITFAASTDGTPIVLSGVTGEDANAGGDLDLLDGGNLTIQGNGAGKTIIDGGNIHRVFHVCPAGGCANSVVLAGLTIQHGSVADGGGIYNAGGTTTVSASTIFSNRANRGGGIYNESTLNVKKGSVIGGAGTSNTATTDGGGIYNADGAVTVDASSVISNTADRDGGGIYNKATLTVQNGSTIGTAGAGNTAVYWGGGIYNARTATADDSTISANTAANGGGIFNSATLHVRNGSIIGKADVGNTATDSGGGIFNTSVTMVDDSTVNSNTATKAGGGIFNNPAGSATVDGSTVSANTAGTKGGGIYNWNSVTVSDSTISANRAADGGGIFLVPGFLGRTTVTGSRILDNTATSNGGGVFSQVSFEGKTSVTGNCIVGNSAMSFFNDQAEQQTATGNWWGAVGGPNTPGADTYGGNVDVSGHLTSPILGCAPDLQMSKANDTSGSTTVGTPFHWTLTVTNTGLISATFDALETILVDELPAIGPTYGTPVAGNFVNVTNGANIQCSIVGSVLTCDAAGGDMTLGPVTSSFEVTFSVTPDAPMTLVNPAGVCRVDPNGNVIETDVSNNDCPADVVNVMASTTYVYLPIVLK